MNGIVDATNYSSGGGGGVTTTALLNAKSPFSGFSVYCCGFLSDLDVVCNNEINCCSLPIVSTRAIADLGTLDELCN